MRERAIRVVGGFRIEDRTKGSAGTQPKDSPEAPLAQVYLAAPIGAELPFNIT